MSDPVVIFLGRLHPIKDLPSVLAAWQLVVRRLPRARLVLAGNGSPDYVATLQAMAQGLGISSSVSFAGFVSGEQKKTLLATSRVLILASHHENFGVAVLEAVQHGLAVVTTPEVALSDFVARHRLGIVATRTADSLANAIAATLTDDDLISRCQEIGPVIVEQEFSVRRTGQLLKEMYAAAST